jgi:diguanylate cyclase (GGDEF)-like protein
MTLAAYIIPNKIRNSMFISVVLSITYFIFPAKNIEGIDTWMFLKIIAYDINITVFCCIASYLTNFYKRKLYADSIELTRVSSTDPLTGIYNRSKFNDELNYWVEYSHRYGSPVSVLIFDIDNFKNINDEYGHLSGDKILQEIVSTVKNTIRKSDVFSRWGGDEFLILLPNTEIDQASEMAERMRSNIQKIKSGEIENITCSFGLVYLKENENAEDVLKKADKLLYDAKGSGKNTVVTELNRLNFI